ncbi:MAG TPA: hypothetical protein VKD22_16215 [Ramlibacter sp.]|nr:hypothetical protein [Ramlibacter sp.]
MSVPMREGAWQRRAPADHCAAARVAAAAGVSSLSKKEMSFADAMNTVAKQRTKGDERRSARLAKRVTTAMDANKRDIMAALKAEAAARAADRARVAATLDHMRCSIGRVESMLFCTTCILIGLMVAVAAMSAIVLEIVTKMWTAESNAGHRLAAVGEAVASAIEQYVRVDA